MRIKDYSFVQQYIGFSVIVTMASEDESYNRAFAAISQGLRYYIATPY